MQRSFWMSLIFGALGLVILLWLGQWQVDRLGQKEALLAQIEARIAADPVALPQNPNHETDRYLPVTVSGTFSGEALRVLASRKDDGAVYRYIQAFAVTNGPRILIDRGFALAEKDLRPLQTQAQIQGHLHWPREVDMFTPPPEDYGLWYARDADAMAAALNTKAVMVIAKSLTPPDPSLTPWTIDTGEIPNDHLNYAITWFSLAAIWSIMVAAFLRQQYRKTKTS